jgi:hypothetical protein
VVPRQAVRKAPDDFRAATSSRSSSRSRAFRGSASTAARPSSTPRRSPSQVAADDQEETDRYWNAIVGNGGQESACGWCKDRWGLSWQITPRTLTEALAAGSAEARRAFDAMMTMGKIDVARIDAARRG